MVSSMQNDEPGENLAEYYLLCFKGIYVRMDWITLALLSMLLDAALIAVPKAGMNPNMIDQDWKFSTNFRTNQRCRKLY